MTKSTTMPSDEELQITIAGIIIRLKKESASYRNGDNSDLVRSLAIWHSKALHEAEVRARIDELKGWQQQWFALATTVPRMQAAPTPLKVYVAERITTLTAEKEGKT